MRMRGLTNALNNDDLDQLKNDPAFIELSNVLKLLRKRITPRKLNRLDDKIIP